MGFILLGETPSQEILLSGWTRRETLRILDQRIELKGAARL